MEKRKPDNSLLEEAYFTLRLRLNSVSNTCKVTEEEAEDLIQEGFLRLHDKELKSAEEAKGKLWTTIRNLAVDRFRRQKFKSPLDSFEGEYHVDDLSFTDREVLFKEMKKILSPLQFKIMTLLAGKEMDYHEIAAFLDMEEGAIRTHVSRARKILRDKLKNERLKDGKGIRKKGS